MKNPVGRPRLEYSKREYSTQVSFSYDEFMLLQREADLEIKLVPQIIRDIVEPVFKKNLRSSLEESMLFKLRGKVNRISKQEAQEIVQEILEKIKFR